MKHYNLLAIFGFSFWIAETAYFGWNETPANVYERFADIAAQAMIWWGIIGDLMSNIRIEKHETNNITTKNVNINGKPIIKVGDKKE